MGVLVASKKVDDPIKTEGGRVVTTLFIDFSDALGQLTGPRSTVGYVSSNRCESACRSRGREFYPG